MLSYLSANKVYRFFSVESTSNHLHVSCDPTEVLEMFTFSKCRFFFLNFTSDRSSKSCSFLYRIVKIIIERYKIEITTSDTLNFIDAQILNVKD